MIKDLLTSWWFTVFDKPILLIAHFYMSLTADSSLLLTGPNWSTTVSVWNLISTGDNVHGGHISHFFCCHFKLTFYIAGVLEPAYCLPFIPLLSCWIHSLPSSQPICPDTPDWDLLSTQCAPLVVQHFCKLPSPATNLLQVCMNTELIFPSYLNSLDVFSCPAYFT